MVLGIGKMAHLLKFLVYKHEDLSLDPQHQWKSWAQRHTTVMPELGTQRQVIPGGYWQATLA